MNRRRLLAGAFLAMLPGAAIGQQAAPQGAPLALVRGFYAKGYKQERMPLSRALRTLYQAALANSKKLQEPVSGLDFAWITASQDEDENLRKTLKYKMLEEAPDRARVEASFRNGDVVVVTYTLIRENNRWVVEDIAYLGQKETLADMLREGAKAT